MKNLTLIIKSLTIGLVLILWTSLQAYAQPVITSVSGNATHGSTITITGSGFGTKNPVKPLIWADFEDGTLSANSSFSRVALAPPNSCMSISTSGQELHSSYSSAAQPNKSGVGKCAGNLNVDVDTPSVYYYVFVRRKYDHANWWNLNGVGNYKFFWPAQVPGGSGRQIIINCWGSNPQCETRIGVQGGSGSSGDPLRRTNYGCYGGTENCSTVQPPVQVWGREEYILKDGDVNVANGTWQFILSGVTHLDRRGDYLTRKDSTLFGTIYIHNFWTNDPPPLDAYALMDDFYVDTTWSRVMIGDQNTFSASTRREIQLPETWSDTSITIQVNAGSFSSLGGAYLYVVDANGQVNQQGYSLCSGCPQPPQNFTVK